jgi:hypothetical protein
LFKVERINESITVGNGKSMTATKVGSLKCRVIQVDGLELDITLYKAKYAPELWVNLFSINKALKNEDKVSNKGLSIFLSKGSASITFDRVIRTTNGSVSGIKLSVDESPVACNTINGSISGMKIDINQFHKLLGHCRSDRLENTGRIHDFKLSGKFETCEVCSITKASWKNFNKERKGGSEVPGEIVFRHYLN